jgi:sulfinoalanine decarboxylase
MLGSSLMCNFLLLNHRHLLTKTCADGDNSYIFRDDDYDSGHSSLQCGRRIDSLKWFLDWKFYGKEGFSDRVENYYELAKFSEQYINKSDVLEMVSKRASFNVCFRYKPKNNDADDFINKLRETLYEEQKALLALAYVDNKLIFRLLISNTNINKETLENLFNTIENTGNRLQNEQ